MISQDNIRPIFAPSLSYWAKYMIEICSNLSRLLEFFPWVKYFHHAPPFTWTFLSAFYKVTFFVTTIGAWSWYCPRRNLITFDYISFFYCLFSPNVHFFYSDGGAHNAYRRSSLRYWMRVEIEAQIIPADVTYVESCTTTARLSWRVLFAQIVLPMRDAV